MCPFTKTKEELALEVKRWRNRAPHFGGPITKNVLRNRHSVFARNTFRHVLAEWQPLFSEALAIAVCSNTTCKHIQRDGYFFLC